MFTDHKNFMRLQSDSFYESLSRDDIIRELNRIEEYDNQLHAESSNETLRQLLTKLERTRNLMFWHDCSTISNHSHFLVMVSAMYDKALYYTDAEYSQKYSENVNVQAEVEKPYMYIFARCLSNDQQLLYSKERLDDIIKLKEELIFHDIPIRDVARVFKGDNPAAQLEVGQQKGGHFFCWICKIKSDLSKNMSYSLKLPILSLEDRINKVRMTRTSVQALKDGKTKLYSDLKYKGVEKELTERGIKYPLDAKLADMKDMLADEMHGIQSSQ